MNPENLFFCESSINLIALRQRPVVDWAEVAEQVILQAIEIESNIVALVGPSQLVEDVAIISVGQIVVAVPSKELTIVAAPDSLELKITDDFTMNNIPANLTGINPTISQIKTEQKLYATLVEI